MSHCGIQRPRQRKQVKIWLLMLTERLALNMLGRGQCRRRVLARIERALGRLHPESRRSDGRN